MVHKQLNQYHEVVKVDKRIDKNDSEKLLQAS